MLGTHYGHIDSAPARESWGGARSWAGALPIRLVLVSRLRLRQARDLWVFNRNELKTRGLPDGKSHDKNDVRLGVGVRHIAP
jgi:hypothetical protein